MAMFTAHIAIMLEVLALAAGLIALHYAAKENAKLIRFAGIILIIFGLGSLICTWFYAGKYYLQGGYDQIYATSSAVAPAVVTE
jgi:hypothetical protein